MSWSIPFNKSTVEEFPAAIDAAHKAADIATQNPAGVPAAAYAVKAAKDIVASGIVAGAGQTVGVQLSGHKNSLEPTIGDSINISIYQVA